MPLSKVRDKARKKRERTKSRLEKLLCPPQTSNPVQPKSYDVIDNTPLITGITGYDADGNPIYEEG